MKSKSKSDGDLSLRSDSQKGNDGSGEKTLRFASKNEFLQVQFFQDQNENSSNLPSSCSFSETDALEESKLRLLNSCNDENKNEIMSSYNFKIVPGKHGHFDLTFFLILIACDLVYLVLFFLYAMMRRR